MIENPPCLEYLLQEAAKGQEVFVRENLSLFPHLAKDFFVWTQEQKDLSGSLLALAVSCINLESTSKEEGQSEIEKVYRVAVGRLLHSAEEEKDSSVILRSMNYLLENKKWDVLQEYVVSSSVDSLKKAFEISRNPSDDLILQMLSNEVPLRILAIFVEKTLSSGMLFSYLSRGHAIRTSSPLFYTVQNRQWEYLRYFLSRFEAKERFDLMCIKEKLSGQVLFHEAIHKGQTNTLAIFLSLCPRDFFPDLLGLRGRRGQSTGWIASQCPKAMGKILEYCPPEFLMHFLQDATESVGITNLRALLRFGGVEAVKELREHLSDQQWEEMLFLEQGAHSPFYVAIYAKNAELLSYLMENCPSHRLKELLFVNDSLRGTCLNLACRQGDDKIARILLQNCPKDSKHSLLSRLEYDRSSVLMAAVYSENKDLIELVLKELQEDPVLLEALLCKKNSEGKHLLHSLAKLGDADLFKRFMELYPEDKKRDLIFSQTEKGRSLLHSLCKKAGNEEMTLYLLDQLNSVDRKELIFLRDQRGFGALHFALDQFKLETVIAILNIFKEGGELFVDDQDLGTSCLRHCVARGQIYSFVGLLESFKPSNECMLSALTSRPAFMEHPIVSNIVEEYFADKEESLQLLRRERDLANALPVFFSENFCENLSEEKCVFLLRYFPRVSEYMLTEHFEAFREKFRLALQDGRLEYERKLEVLPFMLAEQIQEVLKLIPKEILDDCVKKEYYTMDLQGNLPEVLYVIKENWLPNIEDEDLGETFKQGIEEYIQQIPPLDLSAFALFEWEEVEDFYSLIPFMSTAQLIVFLPAMEDKLDISSYLLTLTSGQRIPLFQKLSNSQIASYISVAQKNFTLGSFFKNEFIPKVEQLLQEIKVYLEKSNEKSAEKKYRVLKDYWTEQELRILSLEREVYALNHEELALKRGRTDAGILHAIQTFVVGFREGLQFSKKRLGELKAQIFTDFADLGNPYRNITIPDHYLCILTGDVMRDPVKGSDGRIYEREAIEKWLRRKNSSPFTRMEMNISDLHPQPELLAEISKWKIKVGITEGE